MIRSAILCLREVNYFPGPPCVARPALTPPLCVVFSLVLLFTFDPTFPPSARSLRGIVGGSSSSSRSRRAVPDAGSEDVRA